MTPPADLAELDQPELFELELVGAPAPARARVSEVAPNQWVAHIPPAAVPRFALCRLERQQDGSYRPEILDDWGQHVRLTVDLGDRLGFQGLSYQTIKRLIIGGWVQGANPSPGCWYVNLDSLVAHLARTARGDAGESWWTREREAAWVAARQ